MNLLLNLGVALSLAGGAPALNQAALQQALANYRAMMSGQLILSDLPLQQRLDVIELGRWLDSENIVRPTETRQQCRARLASKTPSGLEKALLDLKCSQRPVGRSAD